MTQEHAEEIGSQEELLRRVDLFRDLDRVDLARLLGATEDAHFAAGAVIVREGEPADSLYLLARGEVEVTVAVGDGGRQVATIRAPGVVGELGLLLTSRTATVQAVTDVQGWRLPRDRFERLVRERPALALTVARSLAERIDRRAREAVGAPLVVQERLQAIAAPSAARSARSRLIAGAFAIGIPALLWWAPAPAGLSADGWHIALVVVGGAVAWLFEPVPDFVATLAMAIVWIVAAQVPPALVFSGFASSSWFLAIAALGLATAMAGSGLLFRLALVMMRLFPPTHRGLVAALLLSGAVLTPLVPTAYGRVATVVPIAHELAQALGYAARSRASAALSFAAILGHSVFSPVFLTGVVTNFLILELMPAAERARFDWLGWLAAAAPAGLVLLVGSAIVVFVLLPPETPPRTSAAVRRSQERALGPLSSPERVSLAALAIFVAGLLLQPVLRVDLAWVAVAAVLVAIVGGALDRQTFRSGIDWATLIFFGVLLGAGGVLKAGGVDRWTADVLTPLARAIGDPALVVFLLALVTVAVRLILPLIPSAFLLVLTLVPAAPQLGLSGWVVGFVVFTIVLVWILPGQHEMLRIVKEMTRGETFTDRHALRVGVGMTIVALVAIAVSLPYWRAIGLL